MLEIMKQPFTSKVQTTFIIKIRFTAEGVNSVWHGTESVSYLDPKLWDFTPTEIKNLNISILSNLDINRGKSLFSGKDNTINTIIPEKKNELLDIILDSQLSI